MDFKKITDQMPETDFKDNVFSEMLDQMRNDSAEQKRKQKHQNVRDIILAVLAILVSIILAIAGVQNWLSNLFDAIFK